MLGLLSSIFYLGACAVSEVKYANTKNQIANLDIDEMLPWLKYRDEAYAHSMIDGNLFVQLRLATDVYWHEYARPNAIRDIKYSVYKSSPAGQDICMRYLKEKHITLEIQEIDIEFYGLHDFMKRHGGEVIIKKKDLGV